MIIAGHIIDVQRQMIFDGEIEVSNGSIVKITSFAEESEKSGGELRQLPYDAPYIMPGFVDAHVHIESTLLTPENYAVAAASKGVVAVVADPHEIANVAGMEGIEFMVDNGRNINFHFNFCAPSCVPCTGFETSGATIDHEIIARMLERKEFCALAEFMNAFGVITQDPECMAKIAAAEEAGKPVDGHAPGMKGKELKQYAAAGISTDHECVSLDEALERLGAGMHVIIREGSAARDFEMLSPLLVDWSDHIMFCSDDKYPDELLEGYIDSMVRHAIMKGYPLWNVLNAACVTPVRHYSLGHGLLQEGDNADFILVDNLRDFNVQATFINGNNVFSANGSGVNTVVHAMPATGWPNVFKAEKICTDDIRVPAVSSASEIKVIAAEDLSIRTGTMLAEPKIEDGTIISDIERDLLKIVVYSRYGQGRPQVAFIHGFGLKRGAMASTIAHDSHNIVATGTNDRDIICAINRLIELKGGIIVCEDGQCFELPLPVAGLMSDLDCPSVAAEYGRLKKMVKSLGCPFSAAFMTLSFMCLPVIPELKLTDKGLFDTSRFEFTNL